MTPSQIVDEIIDLYERRRVDRTLGDFSPHVSVVVAGCTHDRADFLWLLFLRELRDRFDDKNVQRAQKSVLIFGGRGVRFTLLGGSDPSLFRGRCVDFIISSHYACDRWRGELYRELFDDLHCASKLHGRLGRVHIMCEADYSPKKEEVTV